MIGQKNLLKIDLPRNLILVGDRLSGRKTLIHELAHDKNLPVLSINNNVKAIRDIYTYDYSNIIYLLADMDNWSKNCYGAVLKLLEENKSNYFCLTCRNLQSLPDTIISRCQVYYMEPYTEEEIGNEYCTNVGQAKLFTSDLLEFVDKVIDNINTNISNVFKLEEKLKLTETDTGYDFELFFQVMQSRILSRITRMPPDDLFRDDLKRYLYITAKYFLELTVKGVNKQKLLWCWILDMRGDINAIGW